MTDAERTEYVRAQVAQYNALSKTGKVWYTNQYVIYSKRIDAKYGFGRNRTDPGYLQKIPAYITETDELAERLLRVAATK